MKVVFVISFVFILSIKTNAQNLVPNYSFEDIISCPTNYNQLTLAYPWIAPTNDDAELYHVCGINTSVPNNDGPYGYQYPLTGNGYAGFWAYNGPGSDYREYLQIQLIDSLEYNNCYYVVFYTNLQNTGITYAVNNIGINFSNTSITNTGTGYILNLNPNILKFNNPIINDTLNWVEISGIYIANGGEKYITLGNFFDDANTDTINTGNGWYLGAYYYIDDVSVIPIDSILGGMPAYAGVDTSVTLGDSVFIGQQISNLNCNWYDSNGVLIASNISGISVNPTTSTYFVVEQNLCGNITYDTVNVTVLPTSINELLNKNNVQIYPNPTSGMITLQQENKSNEDVLITIFSVLGEQVYYQQNSSNSINISHLENGVYYIQLTDKNNKKIAYKKITLQK